MRHLTGCLLGIAAVTLAIGAALHFAPQPQIVFASGVGALLLVLLVNAIAHGYSINSARRRRLEARMGTAPSGAPDLPRERPAPDMAIGPEDFPDFAEHPRREEIEQHWADGRKGRAVELLRAGTDIDAIAAAEQLVAGERWRERERRPRGARVCLDCHASNAPDAVACETCGSHRLESVGPGAMDFRLPLEGTTPSGGEDTRRCAECGQYNWPDAEECSYCCGQQLGPVHPRPSQFWAPTSFGGVFIYLAMLGLAWLGAMKLLTVVPGLFSQAAEAPSFEALGQVGVGVAFAVGIGGIMMIPFTGALWRPVYAVFPRHEDLVQVLGGAFIAMLIGVAVGWFFVT